MRDNNLTHKFWARAVAFCLFCAMTAVLACCITGVVYCCSKEWYKTGLKVTFTTEGQEWDYVIDGANAVMTDKTGLKEFAYKNRNSMIIYGLIAGISALACFVFLLCSAAHRTRYRTTCTSSRRSSWEPVWAQCSWNAWHASLTPSI